MKSRPYHVAIALVAIVIAGCSKSPPSETASAAPASTPASGVPSVSALDAGPRAAESPVKEELAEQGEKLFKDKGCSACHTFGKKLTGPDLAGVSQRRTARWIEQQILHPDQMVKEDPIARQLFAAHMLQMPNQGLTEVQARAIIEYFKHQDHESGDDD